MLVLSADFKSVVGREERPGQVRFLCASATKPPKVGGFFFFERRRDPFATRSGTRLGQSKTSTAETRTFGERWVWRILMSIVACSSSSWTAFSWTPRITRCEANV